MQTEDQKDILDTLTTFNINARYDDYKTGLYKKCTSAFTEEWIKKIKQTRKWIKDLQPATSRKSIDTILNNFEYICF